MTNLKPGRIALAGAALVLGFAVVHTAMRDKGAGNRAPDSAASAAALADPLGQLEQAARDNPQEAAPWRALAAARFDMGHFAEAVTAYEKAAALAPGEAAVWSALGEARVMASRTDPLPAAAVDAFSKAAALDAKDPRARYFLAVKQDLGGDHQGAIAAWLALLADTPPGAPWEADLRRTIEQVGKIHKIEVASRLAGVKQPAAPAGQAPPVMAGAMAQGAMPPAGMPVAARAIPGPTAADLKAASAIPPSQQREMAEGMVARLEGKLKTNPANVDGWIMLMRSRVTLGQPDKAGAALKAASAANPGQAARIRAEAGVLGVK
ncbi:MAG: hypothetical protein FP826_11600 [Sphingomonadales bacterium]|nr:hypothetical protein [Sphingomonadales bacterium]